MIKISDPEVTRFWMTMDEAVDLVIKAINTKDEKLLIPKLPAYRLGDLLQPDHGLEAILCRDREASALFPVSI